MRKLREVVANVRAVLAVEILAACQALDFRAELAAPSAAGAAVHARGPPRRRRPWTSDRNVSDQIARSTACSAEIVAAAEAAVGGLD